MKKLLTFFATMLLCVNLVGCTDLTTNKQRSVATDTYYRDIIDNDELVVLYDNIKANLGEQKIVVMNFDGSQGFQLEYAENIRDVLLAIEMDCPELKPITEQYEIDFETLNEDYTSINIVLSLRTDDLSLVNNQIVKAKQKVANFVATLPEEMTDYEKVIAIHDWICIDETYDYDMANESHDMLSTILGNSGVCDSFSGAFKYVCEQVGITCLEVRGMSFNPQTQGFTEHHAWNIVFIDGKWKAVDCTYAIQLQDVKGKIPHEYCCMEISDSIKSFRPTTCIIGYSAEQVINE